MHVRCKASGKLRKRTQLFGRGVRTFPKPLPSRVKERRRWGQSREHGLDLSKWDSGGRSHEEGGMGVLGVSF